MTIESRMASAERMFVVVLRVRVYGPLVLDKYLSSTHSVIAFNPEICMVLLSIINMVLTSTSTVKIEFSSN